MGKKRQEAIAARKQAVQQRRKARRAERRMVLFSRLLRSVYAFVSLATSILPFAVSMLLIMAFQWSNDGASTTYRSVSPVGGNCTCTDLFQSYCAESSDAFEGTSYLSAAVIGCQSIVAVVLTWELSVYGVYGGTHDVTRVTLLFSLIALATEMLSLISFYSAYSLDHCGELSYLDRGYSLGWTYFYRAAELLLMLLFVVVVLRSFSTSTRGPPSGSLLFITILLGLSSFSLHAHGWMSSGDGKEEFGTWESCVCEKLCNNANTMMIVSLVLLCIQAFVGLVGSFFAALRAVDNEGLTPKFNVALSVFGLILAAATSGLFLSTVNSSTTPCASTTTYEMTWAARLEIAVCAAFLVNIVMNAVYLKPATIDSKEKPPVFTAQAEGEAFATSGEGEKDHGAVAAVIRLYHTIWWFELKDPRTLAHEQREAEDSGAEEETDDESDEEFGNMGDSQQQGPPSNSTESKRSAWEPDAGQEPAAPGSGAECFDEVEQLHPQ